MTYVIRTMKGKFCYYKIHENGTEKRITNELYDKENPKKKKSITV